MKKYLSSWVLFLLPILVLFLFLEIYNRTRSNNEIIAKQNLLASKKELVDCLIVGNSHGRDGINPLEISPNSVNACIGGSTLFYVGHFLNKYLDELPNCKSVILNASYQTLYYDMDSLPDTRKKYEFYHYMGANYHIEEFSWSRYSLLYAISFSGAINNVIKDLKGKGKDYASYVGYTPSSKTIPPKLADEQCKERAAKHQILMSETVLEENLNYLDDIIDLVEKKNMKLIVLTTPVSPMYNKYKKSPFKNYTSILKSLADKKSFAYLDYSNDTDFNMQHFRDPDHLNELGGELLSRKIKMDVSEYLE